MSVKWIDMGLDQILKNVKFLDETNVRVGIVGDAGERTAANGRITLGEVALINEFGSKAAGIPSRSFIRSALKTPKAKELAYNLAKTAITFGNVDNALHAAGEALAEVMRDKVLHGVPPPNAASTIAKKGFDHPLIETSELQDAIGYELVRSSGITVPSKGDE